eukprot:393721_1
MLFFILPYFSNLLYGIKIKSKSVVSANDRAKEYFTNHISIFIVFTAISGGCYPSILLVSSRMFNLDSLNSGLFKHELFELAKIKMVATVTQGNIPQLIIQILYAVSTNEMTAPIFMSLVASLLSVIIAFATYYAHKSSRENAVFVSYCLQFRNDNIGMLSEFQKNNILDRKGKKEELQKRIANELETSHENIEIG